MGVFCVFMVFLHSDQLDVSAHFSALDDEEFFVIEGSGGRREFDSQVLGRAPPPTPTTTSTPLSSLSLLLPPPSPPSQKKKPKTSLGLGLHPPE